MIGSSFSFVATTGELTTGAGTTASCTVGVEAMGNVKNDS